MGRAIVRKPKAFLFDEPLSNLDAKLRGQMRVEIRRLQRTLGTTSVYVTHDQLEAMTLADKLVVMNAGIIEQVGQPLDVYSDPQSLFVAAFMGSPGMNLIEIDQLRAAGTQLPDAVPANTGTIGIRPEDIALTGSGGSYFTLPATLDAVELVGSESLIYANAQGLGKELVIRSAGIHRGNPGDALTLHVPYQAIHSFDRDTGRKLAVV
jgi:sn-glycerol 3-phosphate transport system ATP-binding protein